MGLATSCTYVRTHSITEAQVSHLYWSRTILNCVTQFSVSEYRMTLFKSIKALQYSRLNHMLTRQELIQAWQNETGDLTLHAQQGILCLGCGSGQCTIACHQKKISYNRMQTIQCIGLEQSFILLFLLMVKGIHIFLFTVTYLGRSFSIQCVCVSYTA